MEININKGHEWRNFQLVPLQKFSKANRFIFTMSRQHGKTHLVLDVLKDFMFRYNKHKNPCAMVVMETTAQCHDIYYTRLMEAIGELPESILFSKGSGKNNPITVYMKRPWFNDIVRVTFAGAGTAVRGNTLHLFVGDELAFWEKTLWLKLYSPMLDDTGGKAFLTSTVNRYNYYHDMVIAYRELSLIHPEIYAEQEYDVYSANYRSQAWIDAREAEYKAAGQHHIWRQEYMNDRSAAPMGVAPFSEVLNEKNFVRLNDMSRVNFLNYVNINLDLGVPGNMPGWTWAVDLGGQVTIMEYLHDVPALDFIPAYLQEKYPEKARIHLYLPHDIHHKSVESGTSRYDRLQNAIKAAGMEYKIVLHDLSKTKAREVLVSRGVELATKAYFNLELTSKGIAHLRNTKMKQEGTEYKSIKYGHFVRNKSDHTADAFCYIAAAMEEYKTNHREEQFEDSCPNSGYEGTNPIKYTNFT